MKLIKLFLVVAAFSVSGPLLAECHCLYCTGPDLPDCNNACTVLCQEPPNGDVDGRSCSSSRTAAAYTSSCGW